MPEFGLTTIYILTISKLVLLAYLIFLFLAWRYKYKPFIFLTATALAIIIFYFVLAYPLRQFWWGTVGDELLIAAYLTKAMSAHWWSDFYYTNLPNFYPPLYFWLTGLIAAPFVHNAIGAAKIGVIWTLIIWFFGTYFYQAWFWKKIYKADENKITIINQPWFWFLVPTTYFLLLDFDTIIFKPYETLAALGCGLWLILLFQVLDQNHWPKKYYWWFGISGGLLFLLFYFWWLVMIPLFIFLIFKQTAKLRSFIRLSLLGILILVFSLPYLLPLFWSYLKYGIENWQAKFFVVSDFFTYLPWGSSLIRNIFIFLSIVSLALFYKQKVVKLSLWAILACYFYQAISLLSFLFFQNPIQAAKPFLFLGGIFIAITLSYGLITFYQSIKIERWRSIFILILSLLALSQLPMIKFIDDPVVLRQIEIDLKPSQAIEEVSRLIKDKVPDYEKRTWFYSGEARFNAYLPLSYYLAHSPHFSHQAANYSKRLEFVTKMTEAEDSDTFTQLADQAPFQAIDTLLLYTQPSLAAENVYSIFLWSDNYPNGGKDFTIYLPANLVSEKDWLLVAEKNNWKIFIRK